MLNCSCCGTEVTSPYFFNGGVYGWTCIKKVNPSAKKNKPKSKCVEVEVLKLKPFEINSTKSQAIVMIGDNKEVVAAHREYLGDGVFSDFIEIGNFKFYGGKWWVLI